MPRSPQPSMLVLGGSATPRNCKWQSDDLAQSCRKLPGAVGCGFRVQEGGSGSLTG